MKLGRCRHALASWSVATALPVKGQDPKPKGFARAAPGRNFLPFGLVFLSFGLLGLVFLSFWPFGLSFPFSFCSDGPGPSSKLIPFILAFWAFISFHFGLLDVDSFHFGLLGLSFWPFRASFPFILAFRAFPKGHLARIWPKIAISLLNCAIFPFPKFAFWGFIFFHFGLLGLAFLSFPFILGFWAFISFHFGLLGFGFLSLWPCGGFISFHFDL